MVKHTVGNSASNFNTYTIEKNIKNLYNVNMVNHTL